MVVEMEMGPYALKCGQLRCVQSENSTMEREKKKKKNFLHWCGHIAAGVSDKNNSSPGKSLKIYQCKAVYKSCEERFL